MIGIERATRDESGKRGSATGASRTWRTRPPTPPRSFGDKIRGSPARSPASGPAVRVANLDAFNAGNYPSQAGVDALFNTGAVVQRVTCPCTATAPGFFGNTASTCTTEHRTGRGRHEPGRAQQRQLLRRSGHGHGVRGSHERRRRRGLVSQPEHDAAASGLLRKFPRPAVSRRPTRRRDQGEQLLAVVLVPVGPQLGVRQGSFRRLR